MSNSSKVQLLLKTRKDLCQQILETQILIYEEELKKTNGGFKNERTLDELNNSLEETSDELSKIYADHKIQELALNRLKLGTTAVAYLCSSTDQSTDENVVSPDEKQCILNLMSKQQHFTTLIMQLDADIKTLEDHLWKSRQKIKGLQSSTANLMTELADMKAARSSGVKGELQKIEDSTKEDLELVHVLQQVFLKLIQGSGINWAADEKLLQLVLTLGTPFKLN